MNVKLNCEMFEEIKKLFVNSGGKNLTIKFTPGSEGEIVGALSFAFTADDSVKTNILGYEDEGDFRAEMKFRYMPPYHLLSPKSYCIVDEEKLFAWDEDRGDDLLAGGIGLELPCLARVREILEEVYFN